MTSELGEPIVVIGGGLVGMATAARLAKLGHPVELLERTSRLGGRWAPYPLSSAGLLVDDAPSVLGFPAPWRDLFRKSGRPLEAKLARVGCELVPVEPLVLSFADGTELPFPSDRGEQFAALGTAYGTAVAERWRDLLDGLDDVWQALRPLGLEAQLPQRRLTRAEKRQLRAGQTVADLAADIGHPHLAALIRSVAHRNGSTPEATPALVAVELSLTRTFGRWHVQRCDGTGSDSSGSDSGRSSVLAERLADRLGTRRVAVHLDTEAVDLTIAAGRVVAVQTPTREHPATAVVTTVHPWQLGSRLQRTLGRPRWLRSAYAPVISHELEQSADRGVREILALSATGVPQIHYRRPVDDGVISTTHDFAAGNPDDPFGVQWRGFRSWRRRPPVQHRLPGVYQAGSFSSAGRGTSQMLLTAALASAAAHDAD